MAEVTILEPISTGDVIDRAVRLYRRNFIPLISVVAVPALIYYASAMMVSYGYVQTLQSAQTGFNPSAALMTLVGFGGYIVYLFAILGAISGMSRAIGDHVMLGEPISFKMCWRFATRRLGDVALMGLIFIPVLMLAFFVLGVVFVVLFMGLAFLVGLGSAAGLPPWLGVIATAVFGFGSVLLFAALMLLVAARVVFVPDALMIEGRSAAAAFGRAFQLGGGRTWYRLGMIAIFSYFVSLATLTALLEPLLGIFWMNGWAVSDLVLHPGWNAAYAAVNQISTLLVWPIWITSLTLLYFDTRVRKEGYDIELMTTSLAGPAYQYSGAVPVFRPPALQWSGPPPAAQRPYMQTGPLGLGGYPVTGPPTAAPTLGAPVSAAPGARVPETGPSVSGGHATVDSASPEGSAWLRPGPELKIDAGPGMLQGGALPPHYSRPGQAAPGSGSGPEPVRCSVCGLAAVPGAQYCIACGDLLQTGAQTPTEDRS